VIVHGETRQERLDLAWTELAPIADAMEAHASPHPHRVRLLRARTVVARADDPRQLAEQCARVVGDRARRDTFLRISGRIGGLGVHPRNVGDGRPTGRAERTRHAT
jgi:hypothetical protein